MASKVLVIDDEVQTRRFLRTGLAVDDLEVVDAGTGEDGLSLCAAEEPDIVVLDLKLPDVNGLDVLKRLREWSEVPVIVLSAEHDDGTIVEALDGGADDYVTKPFTMKVFMARLRANLRKTLHNGSDQKTMPVLRCGALKMDRASHKCWVGEEEVELTPKEFELLAMLMKHAGKVLTHKYLLENVWGPAHADDREYLRVFIKQLREKVESDPGEPRYILTELGVGYRMTDPDDPDT